jgi:alpha-galactosidase
MGKQPVFLVEIQPERHSIRLQMAGRETALMDFSPRIDYRIRGKNLVIYPLQGQRSALRINIGKHEHTSIRYTMDESGVRGILDLINLGSSNSMLMRLTFQNSGENAQIINRFQFLSDPESDNPSSLWAIADNHTDDLGFFQNGWQSWSFSGAYNVHDKPRTSRLGFIQGNQWYNPSTPKSHHKGDFASDMFGVILNRSTREGLLLGFLSQKEQFGTIRLTVKEQMRVSAWASGDGAVIEPDHAMTTDWFCIETDSLDGDLPFSRYFTNAAEVNNYRPVSEILSGWCSWYHYYTDIDSTEMIKNIGILSRRREEFPIQLIQLDDGFQRSVGDWLEMNEKFPDGIEVIAKQIKSEGYSPGLWLAPFIISPRSRTAREHNDWLVKKPLGYPTSTGYNWNTITAALDLTNSEVCEYIHKVIKTAVEEWGYPYLKLDFLYAAAVNGKHIDPTKTRAQILRNGLELIRDAAGEETILLGCGCPLGSGIGIFDAMRIGADVGLDWEPKYRGIEFLFPDEPNIPSVRNALQNAITRNGMHQNWWINDPDCLLLRDSTNLTLAETQTLATIISFTGGNLIISDDLETVSPERLAIGAKLLPLIGKRPSVIDWADHLTPSLLRLQLSNELGDWYLVSFTNWEDYPVHWRLNPADFQIDENKAYYYSLFWEERCGQIDPSSSVPVFVLPHQTICAALKPVITGTPNYVGSNLHISQGLEIQHWKQRKSQLDFNIDIRRKAQGSITLDLPIEPVYTEQDGKPIQWNVDKTGFHVFRVTIEQRSDFCVHFPNPVKKINLSLML